jgi:ABC-type polysaccharide/polyol phosphate transport system ATPase subunit
MSYALHSNQITGPIKEIVCESIGLRSNAPRRQVLDRVSFRLGRGERLGIVGGNGAGKTTLLKIVAGLLRPDSGQIQINGRLTAILALGLGVHPEFTGRESILFGGLLLGVTRRQIEAKLDEIVEFSGLRDFIDQPIRTYSSGMRARLYVSTALSVDPDVLVVDEALSTGDVAFADKCKRRIREIARSGATTIFVSHNTQQMLEMCTRGLFLQRGRAAGEGNIDQVVSSYLISVVEARAEEARARVVTDFAIQRGNGDVLLAEAHVGVPGERDGVLYSGEPGAIRLALVGQPGAARQVTVFVGLMRRDTGEYVGEINSKYALLEGTGKPTEVAFDVRERLALRIELDPVLMATNEYSLWIQLCERGSGTLFSEYKKVAPFYVANRAWPVSEGCSFWNPARYVIE